MKNVHKPTGASLDPSTENLSATVVRGAGLSAGGFVLSKILMLAAYTAVARLITPEEFGQFAAAAILMEAGMLLADSGTGSALVQRRDRIDEAASTAVVSTVVGGVALALVSLACAPLMGRFFGSDEVTTIAAAVSGVVLIRAMAIVPSALLQRRFSFLRRVVSEPASAFAFGVAAVATTSNGAGVWGLVAGFYALAVTELLSAWLLTRWRPRLRLASFAMWRELAAYGRHVLASTLVLRGGDLLPGALLGRFSGVSALGQFRYAERISGTPMQTLLAAGAYVVFPAFSAIATDGPRLEQALRRTLTWVGILAMPTGLFLIPLSEPLATLALGDQWREAGQAAAALGVWAAARVTGNVASELWKATGQPRLLTRLHLIETVLTVVALAAFLNLGPVGAGVSLSVGATGGLVYAALATSARYGLPIGTMLRVLAPSAGVALSVATALFVADRLLVHAGAQDTGVGLLLLLGETLVAVVVYAACLTALGGPVAQELRMLRRGIRSRVVRSEPPTG